jgi:hypothetical protein
LTLAAVVLLTVGEARPWDGACCIGETGCLETDRPTCEGGLDGWFGGQQTDCDDTDNDGLADDCTEGPFATEFPKLYWVYDGNSYGKLQRANLDGSQVETLLADLFPPDSIAIDARTGTVYWTEFSWMGAHSETIWRANLDGTGAMMVLADSRLGRIAVDAVGRKLYWEADGIFKRADLDGSHIEIVLSGNDAKSLAIVHDPRKACTYVDADADGDVDLYDFAAFQECFSKGER